VRAKAGIPIAYLSALTYALCAGLSLQAQTTTSLPQPATTSIQDSANELSVSAGKSVLIDCAQPISRVAIGASEVAEAAAINRTEVMVTGKTAGETSLILWDNHGGRQFFNVTVLATQSISSDKLQGIRRELKSELPGQSVKISTENGTVFLRGTVKDLNSSERAVKIVSTIGKVINLLDVEVPKAEPQILLKVRIASIDRAKAKKLGINLFNLGAGNFVGGVTTGQFSAPMIGASTSTSSSSATTGSFAGTSATALLTDELNMMAYYPGLGLGADIEAMESNGLTQLLAEPNLVASNGKQASFLAGGEYPFPVVQGGSTSSVTIEWKEYGVRLNFIPTITPRGTIRLQVAPEVSALDFADSVTVAGYQVPALTVRKVQTETEMADGQSLIIGGLLDNRETETLMKVPFIGDVPVLGKFFRSMSRTKSNTELIVIVTPEFIDPIPANATLPDLKYPQKFLPPNSSTSMHNPDAKTPTSTPSPAPAAMPVETLIESMKAGKTLVTESSSSGSSSGSSAGQGNTGLVAPATSTAH
jgi:pilus assembly protein CpaC